MGVAVPPQPCAGGQSPCTQACRSWQEAGCLLASWHGIMDAPLAMTQRLHMKAAQQGVFPVSGVGRQLPTVTGPRDVLSPTGRPTELARLTRSHERQGAHGRVVDTSACDAWPLVGRFIVAVASHRGLRMSLRLRSANRQIRRRPRTTTPAIADPRAPSSRIGSFKRRRVSARKVRAQRQMHD